MLDVRAVTTVDHLDVTVLIFSHHRIGGGLAQAVLYDGRAFVQCDLERILAARNREIPVAIFQEWSEASFQGDDLDTVIFSDRAGQLEQFQRVLKGDVLDELVLSEGRVLRFLALALLDVRPELAELSGDLVALAVRGEFL